MYGKDIIFTKYDFVRDSGENPNVKQYFAIKRNNVVISFKQNSISLIDDGFEIIICLYYKINSFIIVVNVALSQLT